MSVYLTWSVAYGRTCSGTSVLQSIRILSEETQSVWRLVEGLCARVILEAILGFRFMGCDWRVVVDRDWNDDIPTVFLDTEGKNE